jgi:hypothetical protein
LVGWLVGYFVCLFLAQPPPVGQGFLIHEDFTQFKLHRIRQEVKQIPVEMLQRVMGDVRKRLTECLERNGGHLDGVIFGK